MSFEEKLDLGVSIASYLIILFLAGSCGWFFNAGDTGSGVGFGLLAVLFSYLELSQWWTRND